MCKLKQYRLCRVFLPWTLILSTLYDRTHCNSIPVHKNIAVSPHDPFPHYIHVTIATNGTEIHFDLQKSNSVHPDLPAVHISDGSVLRLQRTDLPEVWGYVDLDTGSALTLSQRDTDGVIHRSIFGSYTHQGHEYHIQPANIETHAHHFESHGIHVHHVCRHAGILKSGIPPDPEPAIITITKSSPRHKRQNPALSPSEAGKRVMWVDLFYATDNKVYDRFYAMTTHSSDRIRTTLSLMKQYFFSIIVGIDMRFRYGFRHPEIVLRSRLTGYATAAYPSDSPWTADLQVHGSVDVKKSLEIFGTRHRHHLLSLANLTERDVDHVTAISGYDMSNNGHDSAIGYAYIATICQRPQYAISIVEDIGDIVKTTWSVTHEITHTIGAKHDATQGGNTACDPHRQFIMTSMLKRLDQKNRNNPWIFSKCSTDFVAEYINELDRKGKNCLLHPSLASQRMTLTYDYQLYASTIFGYVYDPDQQCKNLYGQNAYFAKTKVVPPSLVCRKMMCYSPSHKTERYHLAAESTICKPQHWCHQGSCVPYNEHDVTGQNCQYGDTPGIVETRQKFSCRDVIKYHPTMCATSTNIARKCCRSCSNVVVPLVDYVHGTLSSAPNCQDKSDPLDLRSKYRPTPRRQLLLLYYTCTTLKSLNFCHIQLVQRNCCRTCNSLTFQLV